MGSFGDLLYDLATAGGRGLEEGMAGKRKEDREAAAFRRMTPLQIERQRGVKGLEEEYTIRGEGRQAKAAEEVLAREETALSGILGPILETYMPPSMPTPERGETELPSPYKAPARLPKAVVSPLLSFLKPPKAATGAGRAPTMTELYIAAQTPEHPLHETALQVFGVGATQPKATVPAVAGTRAGTVTGAQIGATLAAPAPPTGGQLADVQQGNRLLQQLDVLEGMYKGKALPGQPAEHQRFVGGMLASPLGALERAYKRRAGGFTPGEADFVTSAESFRGGEILDFFGKVVPKGEAALAARQIPDIYQMTPEEFEAALRRTRERIRFGMNALQQQTTTPRGDLGGERNTTKYDDKGRRLP